VAVLNKYHHGGRVPPFSVDVMRGTPFGNPFPITATRSRDEAVAEFRRHLWARIQAEPDFAALVRGLHGRDVCCCCVSAPGRPPVACHGYVLLAAASWLAGRETIMAAHVESPPIPPNDAPSAGENPRAGQPLQCGGTR
jgi:hypothetical protein